MSRKCINCGQFDSGTIFPCKSTGGHTFLEQWRPTIEVQPEDPEVAALRLALTELVAAAEGVRRGLTVGCELSPVILLDAAIAKAKEQI